MIPWALDGGKWFLWEVASLYALLQICFATAHYGDVVSMQSRCMPFSWSGSYKWGTTSVNRRKFGSYKITRRLHFSWMLCPLKKLEVVKMCKNWYAFRFDEISLLRLSDTSKTNLLRRILHGQVTETVMSEDVPRFISFACENGWSDE